MKLDELSKEDKCDGSCVMGPHEESCFVPVPDKFGWYCNRKEKNHKGSHIACGYIIYPKLTHNVRVWV